MNSAVGEIGIIGVLLVVNGACAMAEMAIVSAKKARLAQWADEGHKSAARALALSNDHGRMLSTVQIALTLVSITMGVFSGARAAEAIQDWVARTFPFLTDYSHGIGVGLMVTFVTVLSIVLGELLPKRLALKSPERIAMLLAFPMDLLSRLTSPIVWVLNHATEFLLRMLGRHGPADEAPVTGEEIKTLVEQGTQAGVFDRAEQAMMERVLEFADKSIHSIMTPRLDVVYLDVTDDFAQNRTLINDAPHSHFPVVRGSLDSVLGTIHIKEIYSHGIQASEDLTRVVTPPLFIPETSGALHVIEMFKRTGVHVAFIIDEYGSVQGLVTLTDLLEAIVGDLPSSSETGEEMITKREDGSWLIDGTLGIDDFKEHFEIKELPGEERAGFQTIAGFVLSRLGRIPKTADWFIWEGLRFEVVDMDANRIDKIIVSRTPEALKERLRTGIGSPGSP